MIRKIVGGIVWVVVIGLALSFAPTVLRMDHDQRAVLAVFVLCFVVMAIVGRVFYPDGLRDEDDENADLMWRRNADRFRE